MTAEPKEIAARVLRQLEDSWNEGDGEGFAVPFAEDAEFVDIRGDHHTGRMAIAKGHQAIFDSVYKDSTVRFEVVSVRALADSAIYVLTHSALSVPAGPLAGENEARFSTVLSRSGDDWQIVAFHNTMVAPQEVKRPA